MKITEEENEQLLIQGAELQRILAKITLLNAELKEITLKTSKKLDALYKKYGMSREKFELNDDGEFVEKKQ